MSIEHGIDRRMILSSGAPTAPGGVYSSWAIVPAVGASGEGLQQLIHSFLP